MLEVGFFLRKERFEGNNAVVFHPRIKDEFFLEPCINLVFKSLCFYYANYSKVRYSSRSSRECRKQKGNKSKILFFHLWNKYRWHWFLCVLEIWCILPFFVWKKLTFQLQCNLKARLLHRRFLSRQLDAIFVAPKLHQVANMFEIPAISRRQIALKIAPGLHVRFWSCNFERDKNCTQLLRQKSLCKRALKVSMVKVCRQR